MRFEVFDDGVGSLQREVVVVVVGAEAVGVSKDFDAHFGIGFHHHGYVVEGFQRFGTQSVGVEVEVDVEQANALVADVYTQSDEGIHFAE